MEGRDYLHDLPGRYCVSECRQCRLWYQNPRPPDEQIPGLYPPGYAPHTPGPGDGETNTFISQGMARYLKTRWGYHHLEPTAASVQNWKASRLFDVWRYFQVRWTLVPEYVPGGLLLDMGCGRGSQLSYFRRLGWENLQGIELVESAAAIAQRQGFRVWQGYLEDILPSLPDRQFDVVYSTMVLEHLANPFRAVKTIANKLKPGGQFLFSTIVRGSIDQALFGRYWSGFDLPRHLVFMRKKDIVQMLKDDFSSIQIYHQYAPVDFVNSATWQITHEGARLIDKIIVALGKQRLRFMTIPLALAGLTMRISVRCRKK